MAQNHRIVEVHTQPSYQVHIGSSLFPQLGNIVSEQHIALISDSNVAPRYATEVISALADRKIQLYTVPAGEKSKSLEQFGKLLQQMVRDGFDRSSAVLALGGGVVGDLAGFVAASYMRGIALYQLPTSSLAMVDAAVGGKTAVNLEQGKNLVGAFWQPRAVIADVDTLQSLPLRVFKQGMVEAFKAGLLADSNMLETFFALSPLNPAAQLSAFIQKAVQVKADVVAADTTEQGQRAFLNLGHTLAHGLEAVSSHQLTHGDAVAYGLYFVAVLGKNRGYADWCKAAERLITWLQPSPLPTQELADVLPYIAVDKKNQAGKVRWVMLPERQQPSIVADVSREELAQAWQVLQEVAHVLSA